MSDQDETGSSTGRIYLDRGENSTCTIGLFGGCVTSWKVDNVEQLFVSKRTVFDCLNRVRGGVALIFPHYGYWSLGPEDGFANMMTWKVVDGPLRLFNNDVRVVLELSQCQVSNNIWNYEYTLRYEITLLDKELHLRLQVKNESKCSFYFDLLFSAYFKVPDVRLCDIKGLRYAKTLDLRTDPPNRGVQVEEDVKIEEGTHRAFLQTGPKLTVTGVASGKEMYVTKSNLPEVVVRNACDEESGEAMLIEMGHFNRPIVLQIGDEIEVGLKMSIKSESERRSEIIHFY